jgi:NTP pyrophosphatase (non-canonical NTP hydrolase)
MDMDRYQDQAVQIMARDLEPQIEMATLALGLAGEAGEVADIVKKLIGHGHPMNHEAHTKLMLELGDILWYVAAFAELVLQRNLSEVAGANIEKLRARYPDGFTTERSMNRDPEHDRA